VTETASMSHIADRLEIIELAARHAFLLDSRNLDTIMDLWTDDDPVFDQENLGLKKYVGKEAIRDYLVTDAVGNLDATCHLMSNHIVENITDDTATGCHTVLMKGDVKGGGPCEATVYYDDRYVREDGRWKLASRTVTPLTKMVLGGYEMPENE
jgi:ketosteroid isomerase-like protein